MTTLDRLKQAYQDILADPQLGPNSAIAKDVKVQIEVAEAYPNLDGGQLYMSRPMEFHSDETE